MSTQYKFEVEFDKDSGTYVASWGDESAGLFAEGATREALNGSIAQAILRHLGISFDYELPDVS